MLQARPSAHGKGYALARPGASDMLDAWVLRQ